MSDDFIKEAKSFRSQMKWCSIMCWIVTLVFIFMPTKNPEAGLDWIIIPIGGTVFSLIYFKMDSQIKEYEKLN